MRETSLPVVLSFNLVLTRCLVRPLLPRRAPVSTSEDCALTDCVHSGCREEDCCSQGQGLSPHPAFAGASTSTDLICSQAAPAKVSIGSGSSARFTFQPCPVYRLPPRSLPLLSRPSRPRCVFSTSLSHPMLTCCVLRPLPPRSALAGLASDAVLRLISSAL